MAAGGTSAEKGGRKCRRGNLFFCQTIGPEQFGHRKDYIEALLIIIYDRKAEMSQVRLYMASQDRGYPSHVPEVQEQELEQRESQKITG